MAIATTQLYSRQSALLAGGIPLSIDSAEVPSGGTATYTVPAGTGFILLSTDDKCLFRGAGAAAAIPSDLRDGTESAWLHPGQDRGFRVAPGQTISFRGNDASDSKVSIERYAGTNAALPPD